MYIALRTDIATTTLVLLSEQGQEQVSDRWESGRQLSSQLLDHIQGLLQSHGTPWAALTGVIVFRGPGSFTGLRIGVTVANAIACAQAIPIVGTQGAQWIGEGVARLRAGTTDKQVAPAYGAEANVTKPGRRVDGKGLNGV